MAALKITNKNNHYGVSDSKGNVLILERYDKIEIFEFFILCAKSFDNDSYKYVLTTYNLIGILIDNVQCDSYQLSGPIMRSQSNVFIDIESDISCNKTKFGFINKYGNVILRPIYNSIIFNPSTQLYKLKCLNYDLKITDNRQQYLGNSELPVGGYSKAYDFIVKEIGRVGSSQYYESAFINVEAVLFGVVNNQNSVIVPCIYDKISFITQYGVISASNYKGTESQRIYGLFGDLIVSAEKIIIIDKDRYLCYEYETKYFNKTCRRITLHGEFGQLLYEHENGSLKCYDDLKVLYVKKYHNDIDSSPISIILDFNGNEIFRVNGKLEKLGKTKLFYNEGSILSLKGKVLYPREEYMLDETVLLDLILSCEGCSKSLEYVPIMKKEGKRISHLNEEYYFGFYGCVNSDGQLVVPTEFSSIIIEENGLLCNKDGETYLFSFDGKDKKKVSRDYYGEEKNYRMSNSEDDPNDWRELGRDEMNWMVENGGDWLLDND